MWSESGAPTRADTAPAPRVRGAGAVSPLSLLRLQSLGGRGPGGVVGDVGHLDRLRDPGHLRRREVRPGALVADLDLHLAVGAPHVAEAVGVARGPARLRLLVGVAAGGDEDVEAALDGAVRRVERGAQAGRGRGRAGVGRSAVVTL